jgi:hypothetical protein
VLQRSLLKKELRFVQLAYLFLVRALDDRSTRIFEASMTTSVTLHPFKTETLAEITTSSLFKFSLQLLIYHVNFHLYEKNSAP